MSSTEASTYNTHQQIFGINLLSNILRGYVGKQQDLQYLMQRMLLQFMPLVGNWETVFGPVVWKSKPDDTSTPADNTWFVARCPNLVFEDGKAYDTYVVSVGASMSSFDWLIEDLQVFSVVDFKKWVSTGILNTPTTSVPIAGGTYIALGTAKGTHTILSTVAPVTVPGARLSLYSFLLKLTGRARTRR